MPHNSRSAAVTGAGGGQRMRTASIEDPRPNEVLVRMVGTGICQTDAHIRDQDYSTPLSVILRP